MTKCNLKQVPQYTYFLIVTFYCLKNNSIKEKGKQFCIWYKQLCYNGKIVGFMGEHIILIL